MFGKRRTAIRKTWLSAAKSLSDTVVRFAVGNEDNQVIRQKLEREMDEFNGEFLKLDVDDCNSCLSEKLTHFLLAVDAVYDADWILKVDDDVYLSPLRLPPVMAQWDRIGASHTACFHHGAVSPPHGDDAAGGAGEPAALLLGEQYPLHAYGSIFAVRGEAARSVVRHNAPALRRFASEGVTLGMWLLAFNVTFFEDTRLCEPRCRQAAVAFQDLSCRGLCTPLTDITAMHEHKGCSNPPDPDTPPRYLPSQSGAGVFDAMKVP